MTQSKEIAVGVEIRLISRPPYLKTAEPMPMLRPSDIIPLGTQGVVMDRRPGGYWGVRFPQGAFLMESQYIEVNLDGEENFN
ncbi:MAG: regulatory protein SipA [Microcystaceae cyanobacterium]